MKVLVRTLILGMVLRMHEVVRQVQGTCIPVIGGEGAAIACLLMMEIWMEIWMDAADEERKRGEEMAKNSKNPSVKWTYLDQTNVKSHKQTCYLMHCKIAHLTKLFVLQPRHGIESYHVLPECKASTQTKTFLQNNNISIKIDCKATNKHTICIFANFDV